MLEAIRQFIYVYYILEVFTMDETLEWGVDRIDADIVHEYNLWGTGVKVAIMDTGIDYDHPDLAANTMHVASIVMSTTEYKDKGWFTYATATVKIVDADGGKPVKNATVSGRWTGLTDDSDSDSTDSNGEVALDSDSVKNAHGTFTFTVTGVERDGWIYNSEVNEETRDSITVIIKY
jgi:subtilisin family serine protease